MKKYTDNFFFTIFLISIFLIKLPVFYITPHQYKILTTHTLAKFLLLLLFLSILIKQIFKKNRLFNFNNIHILIPFLFFITQALSGLMVIDFFYYLKDLHNLFFAFLIFFISFFILRFNKNGLKIVTNFIVVTGLIVLLFDIVYFIFSQSFLNFIKLILEKESFPVYQVNLDRGRFNLYLYTELFFPFFFIYYLKGDTSQKVMLFFIISLLIFTTYISNFRHRLLFLFLELVFIFFLFRKSFYFKSSKFIFFIFIIIFFTAPFFTRPYQKQNLIDRLIMTYEGDVRSAYFRLESLKLSTELFFSSPLLGVGLGNYKIYVNDRSRFFIFDRIRNELNSQTLNDPHSIFSKTLGETGILGILAFLTMVFFFFKNDLIFFNKYVVNNNQDFLILAYIISFWAYFIVILITPSITLFRGGWFWFLRGVIEGYYFNQSQGIRKSK